MPVCAVVPPHMLQALRKHPDGAVRDAVNSTLATGAVATRNAAPAKRATGERAAGLYRLVHDCGGGKQLPGTVRRRENEPPAHDEDVDRVYDACGTTYRYFQDMFGRNSLDGHGMHLSSSVHYGHRFDNAVWDGARLLCGDGDGVVFRSFTTCLDVTAHELTHGLIQSEGGLEYAGESGALNESLADVFGLLVKQWSLGERADGADWTVGAGQFIGSVHARGLRSLSKPGYAYDDPLLGKDPQPSHMRHYVAPMRHSADVHINSGIPNHAFYLLAVHLGGYAWDVPGRIWYHALCSGLSLRCDFGTFARATLRAARAYGRKAVNAASMHGSRLGYLWGPRRGMGMTDDPAARADDGSEEVFLSRRPGYGVLFLAVTQILSDGKPRSAAQIRDEAVKASLLKPTITRTQVYSDLSAYIQHSISKGRTPAVLLDAVTHEFRLSGPVDSWPSVTLAQRPRYTDSQALEAIAQRLRATSVGEEPSAFEQATCDAFEMMGFVASHIGGFGRPDGILEAPLGPLSFRAVVECKSVPSGGRVRIPQVQEPAKFRDLAGADFAVLVGPSFKDELSLHDELKTHKVSLWTVDDIVNALRIDVDAFECRELFAPGFVNEPLAALEFKRIHGAEKRVLFVRQVLRREGFATQRSLVGRVDWAQAPVWSLDAAMLLVESELQKAGITDMATREEIKAAMDDLVRAEEAVAVPGRDGIVIRRGLSASREPAQTPDA